MMVNTDDGLVRAAVTRDALSHLSRRSHVTPDEVASAYQIEDIVRSTLRSDEPADRVRLAEADF